MKETKNTECNIVGPHSHLVAGKTFHCEKEGKPTCHLEEKKYPLYRKEYNQLPELVSPSDKTWEEKLQKIIESYKKVEESGHIPLGSVSETVNWDEIRDLLTSATIKAKDEVLKEMLLYRKSLPQITTEENILDFIVSFVNEKGINLEEPKS